MVSPWGFLRREEAKGPRADMWPQHGFLSDGVTWHKQWAPLIQLKGFLDWVLGWQQGWACSQVMAERLP